VIAVPRIINIDATIYSAWLSSPIAYLQKMRKVEMRERLERDNLNDDDEDCEEAKIVKRECHHFCLVVHFDANFP